MKSFRYLIIIFAFASCSDNDFYVIRKDYINIVESNIPDTIGVYQLAQITAKAEVYNSCYRDLYVVLKKSSDFEYTLRGYGTLESHGICPYGIISIDTIIDFYPTKAGMYLFHVMGKPDSIIIDTMIVK
jgi:hypothetical protein